MARHPLDILMRLQTIRASGPFHRLNGLVALTRSFLESNAASKKRTLAEVATADQGLQGQLTVEVGKLLYRTGVASLPELSRYRGFFATAVGNPLPGLKPVWVTLPELAIDDLEGAVEALQAAAPKGVRIQGVCLESDPPLSPIELFARLRFGYRKPEPVAEYIRTQVESAFTGSGRGELLTVFRAAFSEGADSGGAYSGFLTAAYSEVYEEAFRRTPRPADDDIPF